MLRMSFFPLNSEREAVERSDFTRVKSGALLPFAGRLPIVFTGFPFNVIFAIIFFSNLIKLFHVETFKWMIGS
jgi:hypothetical protein